MNIHTVFAIYDDFGSNSYTIIGVTTAICGNLVISIALNVQRYAHLRLQKEAHSSCKVPGCYSNNTVSDTRQNNNSIDGNDYINNDNNTRPNTSSSTPNLVLEPSLPIRPSLKPSHRTLSRTSIISYYQPQSGTHSFTSFGTNGILANVETSPHHLLHKVSSSASSATSIQQYLPTPIQYSPENLTTPGNAYTKSAPQTRSNSRRNSLVTLLKVPLLPAPYSIAHLSPQLTHTSNAQTQHSHVPPLPLSSPELLPAKQTNSIPFVGSSSLVNVKSTQLPSPKPTIYGQPSLESIPHSIGSKLSKTHTQKIVLNIPEITPELDYSKPFHNAGQNDIRRNSCYNSDPNDTNRNEIHDDNDNKLDDSDYYSLSEPNYLKSSLWWLGAVLMTVGETGNFIAYGFAPASVVSPLGVLALVSNCIIAPIFFNEPIAKKNYTGVGISVLGILLIITSINHSKPQFPSSVVDSASVAVNNGDTVWQVLKEQNPHDYILHVVSQLSFHIYLIVVLSLILVLLFGSNIESIWAVVCACCSFLRFKRNGKDNVDEGLLTNSRHQQYNSISVTENQNSELMPSIQSTSGSGINKSNGTNTPASNFSPSSSASSLLFKPRMSTLFSNLGLVALFGAFTALSTKCLSSIINFSITAALKDPLTYSLIFVLVSTAVLQVIFLNRALRQYNATVVIPVHFVFFTISVITGSAIAFHDFENSTKGQLVRFFTGCLLTFVGVWYITAADPGSGSELDTETMGDSSTDGRSGAGMCEAGDCGSGSRNGKYGNSEESLEAQEHERFINSSHNNN